MTFFKAQHYAIKISEWLSPYCERIEIAGSIRRQRAVCNDIDLVIIPKIETQRDLVNEIILQKNLCAYFLIQWCVAGRAKMGSGDIDAKNITVHLPKCQLDVFFATEKTFGTVLLCRTGSKEHNIWLASRARERGSHWFINEGLRLPDQPHIIADSEERIYTALGLPYIDPTGRELSTLTTTF